MKITPYPLERDLGMSYYASDADGIGGRLRTIPEDFLVEEIPLPDRGGTTGPYQICRLTKKNWELQHAVKEIAKRLAISHRRIGWAGTKDRNAITKQWISIYDVTPEEIARVQLRDITLELLGQSNEALSLGQLQGNAFDLVIRDCEHDDLPGHVQAIRDGVLQGVPNYFGLQRFGAIRPVTHVVGEWILRGDYEQAVLAYVAMEFSGESEDRRKIRKAFLETRDPEPALRDLPKQMAYERAMLHHLHVRPGDYAGALQELPPKLLSLFVSAFQSYIFNCTLSRRFEDGYGLTTPVEGDQLLFLNGRTDSVTTANKNAVSTHIARGRCSIALFMPGKEPFVPRSHGEQVTADHLAGRGITTENFLSASRFVRTKFDGAWRPIALRTEIAASVDGRDVRLAFTLPPGHYATTVCREFMKADPVRMI